MRSKQVVESPEKRAAQPQLALERYLSYLKSVRNLSDHTIRAYRHDVGMLQHFLDAGGRRESDPGLVRPFISSLSRSGISSRTINRVLSAVRGYYRFMQQFHHGSDNPFSAVRGMRGPKNLPSFLFEEETEGLLEATGDRFGDVRDLALVEFLYSTGCRIAEAVSLDVMGIDLAERSAVVRGKGAKERLVFLGGKAKQALVCYLDQRRRRIRPHRPEKALFINARGARLTSRGARYLLSRHARRRRFSRTLTPHTFRHSFATHILNRGADIRVVQELLGHASLSSTQVYTHVGLDRLKDVHRKAHPHGKIVRGRQ